jgi:hypothetical protein
LSKYGYNNPYLYLIITGTYIIMTEFVKKKIRNIDTHDVNNFFEMCLLSLIFVVCVLAIAPIV